MMNLLFLSQYFYPEVAASSYLGDNIREDSCKNGIGIKLFVPIPSRGISNVVRKEYKRRKEEHMYNDMLTIRRFSLPKERKSFILRAFRYFLCCLIQLYYGLTTSNIDVMFMTSTPPIQGAMGALIRKWRKIPFIYNLQDIFPDSLVGTGLASKGGLLWKIGRVIENFTYKHADKIIVISEDFKRNIMAKGVLEEKIEVIYNWVDEKSVVPIAAVDNPLYEEFELERDKFYVVYAGNLGAAQNIDIIIEAAVKTCQTDILYLIFGKENQSRPYIEKVKMLGINNIRFLPIQPYSRVSFVYSLGNAAIVSCKKGFGSIGMPSKTWSIMSSGTAVLASFDRGTDMQRIIEGNKVGIFTEAGNINEFIQAILYLKEHSNECKNMGERGRQFILNNLTREIGTSKYIKTIKQVAKKIENECIQRQNSPNHRRHRLFR